MRAVVLLAGLVGACAAEPTRAPESPAARPVTIEPPARDEGEPSETAPTAARAAEATPALSREDCAAFERARALGVAVVVASEPDCSSVGHRRIVLEVQRLARGSGIAHVRTSRTLFSHEEPQLELGDTVLVAIEPEIHPAETVYCVSLPERQGSLRHAVKVDSIKVSEPLLDTILRGQCGERAD